MQDVHTRLVGMLGDGPAADLLAAQIDLETGAGRGAFNWNFGNIKGQNKEGARYMSLKTYEVVDGKRVDVREPFTAYDSLDEGLQAYVEYLDKRGLLEAADTGDVDTYNRALKAARYYTEDEAKYGAALRRRVGKYGAPRPGT